MPALLILMFFACIDIIDLKTQEKEEVLIIEGFIYNDRDESSVSIKKSAAFVAGPDGVELPVSGATVTISEIGGPSVTLTESTPGVYTSDQLKGQVGKGYQLRVETGGNTYESLVEQMPAVIPATRLSWARRDESIRNSAGNVATKSIIILKSDALLPDLSDGSFLRFRVEGIYEYRERASASNLNDQTCYVPEVIDFNNLALVDGRLVNNGELVDQPVLERTIDFKFAYNYCFSVVTQSITRNAFNFWVSIQNEFERTGDIFEAPPAKIKGNIVNTNGTENDVIGLFSAISNDTSKLLVSGIELNNPRIPCRSFGAVPDACFDCLIIEKSSLVRPECFD